MAITNYYNRARATSETSLVDILMKKNNVDNKWEFYVVIEFSPKSDINNYNELLGRRITNIIEIMNDSGLDDNIFSQKLEDIPAESIKFEHTEWEYISVK
jgi:hypothetical protein